MPNIQGSRGYDTSYRGSNAPGAFYAVFTGDFGEPAPAVPTLAYEAGTGSLATGTAYVQITWITAEGVSLPSAEVGVAVSASTGGVLVTIPSVPTNGGTVIGWQLYSSGTTTDELLNTAATSTKQHSPTLIVTNSGAVYGFPIADTHVVLAVYGTGAAPSAIDNSGIQAAFPSVPANSTADYDFIVPNAGSEWKVYKPVNFQRPDGIAETTGISLSANLDCIAPIYPAQTAGSLSGGAWTPGTYSQASVATGTYMVMNGSLFQAVQAGTQSTATAFIGSAAFNVAKGTSVTDGSVTWLCLGKAVLVRAHFANASGSAAVPAAQEYDLFEF